MAFMANFVGTGIGFYGFGVFFKPLAAYFGWGRAGIGLGNGLALVVAALWAPRVGRAVDKWGMRPLLIGGSLVAALGLALMSRMTQFWQYLVIYGVMFSLANLHMGDIVTGSTVARQFPLNTGRAIGIATVGVSFGGVVMPPVAQAILEAYNWRMGFLALSAVALCIVLIPAFILLRGWDHRQLPEIPSEWAGNEALLPVITREQAFRTPEFWKMVALFSLSYLPLGTMLVQQVPFLTDMGIPPRQAAWILSLTATMGMIGKFSWGYFFDKMQGRHAVASAIAIQAIAVTWLLHATTLWQALIFGAVYGFGMGGLVPLHTAMRARQFGAKHIGSIMGISSPFIMLAQAGGQPFSGWVFDVTGSYRYSFDIFILCYFLAIAIAMTLKDPESMKDKV